MADIELKVIDLINKGCPFRDMTKILGITPSTLWEILFSLRKKGYNFARKYYSSGDIIYIPTDKSVAYNQDANIITSSDEDNFVALLYSDLHMGRTGKYTIFGSRERLDLVYSCFDYCAKEGIHTIIHGGDLADSFMNPYAKADNLLLEQTEQINHIVNDYPCDSSILKYTCLGNHDWDLYRRTGQDLATILHERRHDIIPIGYGSGIINIKNDSFGVFHKLGNGTSQDNLKKINTFWLKGHSHQMFYDFRNSIPSIFIPALIDDEGTSNQIFQVLKMTLQFKGGYIYTCLIEQLAVNFNFQRLGASVIEMNSNRKLKDESINLEEPLIRARKI